MKTTQEKQGYRIKSARPVCGNCVHCIMQVVILTTAPDLCKLGDFEVDIIHGTCCRHEWTK